jgi:hypothetical protein
MCLLIVTVFSSARADSWSKSIDTDITLTQNNYSNSWVGGEAGTISWVWNANGMFEKQLSPTFNLKNTSKLSFGQTHLQDKTTKDWARPEKSTDLIDIENLGLFTMNWHVDPFCAVRFESQFLDASVPELKRYLSPAKLTESAGAARRVFKSERRELLTRAGFAFRQIFTQEITDLAAEETETNTTTDGGFESVTDLKMTLSETLSFVSKLSLYKAVFYSESDNVTTDDWKAIDMNWENRLSAAVAKYVTVSLYTQLLYDKETDTRGRFKETLALGLTYKLF